MKPIRSARYLAWIRTLPCLVCGRTAGVKAAHTGPHGIAQKSADNSAVPLCARHHRTGRDSYHKLGARGFEQHHGLDLRAVVMRLNAKPSIRIEAGSFFCALRRRGLRTWGSPDRIGVSCSQGLDHQTGGPNLALKRRSYPPSRSRVLPASGTVTEWIRAEICE
jgi:hypothetical protein